MDLSKITTTNVHRFFDRASNQPTGLGTGILRGGGITEKILAFSLNLKTYNIHEASGGTW